ncbi:GntR family transcriptional regulator [Nocardioides sp. NPDC006303]|uniref:GntR family transcriptional regulator n=1 Tax=Nocardioides sp. NPDC006303 TaxID=3156747 RepID=UPI0033B303D4
MASPRNALANEVYENLLDALMSGRLAAGDRLVMDRLAEDLGVSRSPVRDALLRLHREGVVEPGGRRGYLVREGSDMDIHNFYAARTAVEAFAAEQLVALDIDAWGELRELLNRLAAKAPLSVKESFDANRTFHRAIVAATGNTYLEDMFDTIWNRSRTALTFRSFAAAHPYAGFVPDHAKLIDALEQADPEQARTLMTEHIAHGLEQTTSDAGSVDAMG